MDTQMDYITRQPESRPAASNPFFEPTASDWSVDLYSCCDDMGECKYYYIHIDILENRRLM